MLYVCAMFFSNKSNTHPVSLAWSLALCICVYLSIWMFIGTSKSKYSNLHHIFSPYICPYPAAPHPSTWYCHPPKRLSYKSETSDSFFLLGPYRWPMITLVLTVRAIYLLCIVPIYSVPAATTPSRARLALIFIPMWAFQINVFASILGPIYSPIIRRNNFLVMLGIKLRSSCMKGKDSITELYIELKLLVSVPSSSSSLWAPWS